MKFSDGTSIDITSIVENDDNTIVISLYSTDYNKTVNLFKNPENLVSLETDNQVYNNYTVLKRITSFEDEGIIAINVVLEYDGLSNKLDELQSKLNAANETIEMLSECLMELGDILYA